MREQCPEMDGPDNTDTSLYCSLNEHFHTYFFQSFTQLNVFSWQVKFEDNERLGFEGMEASRCLINECLIYITKIGQFCFCIYNIIYTVYVLYCCITTEEDLCSVVKTFSEKQSSLLTHWQV